MSCWQLNQVPLRFLLRVGQWDMMLLTDGAFSQQWHRGARGERDRLTACVSHAIRAKQGILCSLLNYCYVRLKEQPFGNLASQSNEKWKQRLSWETSHLVTQVLCLNRVWGIFTSNSIYLFSIEYFQYFSTSQRQILHFYYTTIIWKRKSLIVGLFENSRYRHSQRIVMWHVVGLLICYFQMMVLSA